MLQGVGRALEAGRRAQGREVPVVRGALAGREVLALALAYIRKSVLNGVLYNARTI